MENQITPIAVPSQAPSASLYIGDLAHSVDEALLFELFSGVGPILSIRVCRDSLSRKSLGYAYVNFMNHDDALKCIDQYNYTKISGKPCRIMWSNRDPSQRKTSGANIFIKNLAENIDNKQLHDTFSQCGPILSCKVATDDSGTSLGYGFVHFESEESAKIAINDINGMLISDKKVVVTHFKPKSERGNQKDVFILNANMEKSIITAIKRGLVDLEQNDNSMEQCLIYYESSLVKLSLVCKKFLSQKKQNNPKVVKTYLLRKRKLHQISNKTNNNGNVKYSSLLDYVKPSNYISNINLKRVSGNFPRQRFSSISSIKPQTKCMSITKIASADNDPFIIPTLNELFNVSNLILTHITHFLNKLLMRKNITEFLNNSIISHRILKFLYSFYTNIIPLTIIFCTVIQIRYPPPSSSLGLLSKKSRRIQVENNNHILPKEIRSIWEILSEIKDLDKSLQEFLKELAIKSISQEKGQSRSFSSLPPLMQAVSRVSESFYSKINCVWLSPIKIIKKDTIILTTPLSTLSNLSEKEDNISNGIIMQGKLCSNEQGMPKRRRRNQKLRSSNPWINENLVYENGKDDYSDLISFIET